jgi:hypothetical protein
MLARFCAAHDQSAAEEFFVVQFLNGPFRFLDGLHLNKRKTLRALVVPVAYYLRILHVPHAVEQFEEIALGGVEGQVAHVMTSTVSGFRGGREGCAPLRVAVAVLFVSVPSPKNAATRCQNVFF